MGSYQQRREKKTVKREGFLSELLNDNGGSTSTTVADAGATKLALLEEAGEGDNNSGTGAANGMSK